MAVVPSRLFTVYYSKLAMALELAQQSREKVVWYPILRSRSAFLFNIDVIRQCITSSEIIRLMRVPFAGCPHFD